MCRMGRDATQGVLQPVACSESWPRQQAREKKNDVYEKCPVRMCVATSSLRFEWFVQSPGECLVAQLLEHNVILGAPGEEHCFCHHWNTSMSKIRLLVVLKCLIWI